jgi:integrase
MKRQKTKYPGVTFIVGKSVVTGKNEKIFYIRYRKDGKQIEERAGRQVADKMTAARANQIRVNRIQGRQASNTERREAVKNAQKAEAARLTVSRLWGEYKAQKADNKGMATDRYRFEKHIEPHIGNKEFKDLVPLDIKRIENKMKRTHSLTTVKHVLELITRLNNFATDLQLCPGLSFKIKKPTIHNEKTEDLTPEQLSRLLEVIKKDDHEHAGNMMLTALYTGMRRGEMFKLKWQDIDFHRGFITLRDPKGGPDQKIPLNEAARAVFKSAPKHPNSEYVFWGKNGARRTDIKRPIGRIKKAAGLSADFRPLHGLRHVYASMLASTGKVDMYTLQKLMTHKNPQMTQRYAHLRDDALKSAAELAGDLVKQAAK